MPLIENAESLNRSQLLLLQQSAWKSQRRHVMRNSEFYEALWQESAPPEDLNDLPMLPLSSKQQLRESQKTNPPFGNYLAVEPESVVRLHRTSGTTGQAMNIALSRSDCDIFESVGGRNFLSAGLTPQHVVVHCLNYQMWMGGVTDHRALERTGAMVVPFGVGNSELLIRTIRNVGIDAISCTPSYPAVLERVLAETFERLHPRDLGLRLGLFGGEPGLDDQTLRDRIRNTWGMEPRNANYGVSDVLSIIAAQCEQDFRLHFLAGDVLYPELIDPENENSIAIEPGKQGELVLTHLQRECQPLVRFRTGDIIAVDETDACSCGRTGMRFRVIGRSDEMVVIRGLNVFPTMVAAVVNCFPELSGDYRIILESAPPYDVLQLQVELAESEESMHGIGYSLERAIKSQLGVSAEVTVLQHGSFPATAGKTARVIRTYT